jgi:N-acetylmuramoyl-L-alanine amidase
MSYQIIILDPGHGMSNRKPGVFDPGCERGDLHEADIALVWAHELGSQLQALGIDVFFTRRDNKRPTPVGSRAKLAEAEGCDILVSIHVNDADGALTGTETLYSGLDDIPLAERCQAAMVKGLGLKDRGVKQRGDLAVLKFRGRAVLLELGFIGSKTDVFAITDVDKIKKTCALLAAAILQ